MKVNRDEAQTLLDAYGALYGHVMMDKDDNGACEAECMGELLAETMAGGGEVRSGYRINMMPLSAEIRAELRDELLGVTPTEDANA